MRSNLCEVTPDDWDVLSIKEICLSVTSGGTPSRANKHYFINGTYPWVKTQELTDKWIEDCEEYITEDAIVHSSAKVLPRNTVLMAMYGATVGKLGLLRRPMTCNQACCALLVDDKKTHYRYVFYQLLYSRPQIISLAIGAAQQNLSVGTIKALQFPYPNLPTQRRIAHILGTLDDKIENNRKTAKTLEALAQAIFKSWFVDFDPVRAKVSGESAESICNRLKMTPEILALFPDCFEDSELGEIPKGWRVQKIGEIVNRQSSGTKYDQKNVFQKGLVPVYDQGRTGIIGFHNNRPDISASSNDPIIIFANHTCSMRLIMNDFSAIQNVIPFKSSVYNIYWLYEATKNKQGWVEYKGHWPDFSIINIVVPNDYLTIAFGRHASCLFQRINRIDGENNFLTEIRNALLPRLISGELMVDMTEELVEEAIR